MQRRDPYRILGVARHADRATIEAAYHALVRQYQPDDNTSPDAAARTQDINWAHDVLTDPHQQTWEQQQALYTTQKENARQRLRGCCEAYIMWALLSGVVRVFLLAISGDRDRADPPPHIIPLPPPVVVVTRLPDDTINLQWVARTFTPSIFTVYQIRDETTLLWAEGMLRDSGHNTTVAAERGYVLKYNTASNGYYCPPGAYTEGERPQLNYCKTLRNVTPPKRE
jgi:hypothetical protein